MMAAMMEADMTAALWAVGVATPKTVGDPARHGAGSVALGGRRIPVTRPRMRALDGLG